MKLICDCEPAPECGHYARVTNGEFEWYFRGDEDGTEGDDLREDGIGVVGNVGNREGQQKPTTGV